MLMDAKKISQIIRAKKKKMMMTEPDLVDTDSRPDENPNEMYDTDTRGRIEATLDTPHKIDARDTEMAMSDQDAMTVGLTDEEKTRMKRLRAYLGTLDLDHHML